MLFRFVTLITLALIASSCRSVRIPPVQRQNGVGAACVFETDCRIGMACVNGACAPAGTLQSGDTCDLTAGCADGLYCSLDKKCAPAGLGALNAPCSTSGDCTRGLYCGLSGIFQVCLTPGTLDIGGACTSAADCLAGLGCAGGLCAAGAVTVTPPTFSGVSCSPDTGNAFRSYFEVPAIGGVGADFFRLPFPNEARNRLESYDIAGFPGPTGGSSGGMLAQYVNVAATENGGFGTNQALTMRFSQPIKTDSNQEVMLSYGVSGANVFFYKVEPIDPANVAAPDGAFGCATDAFDGSTPKWRFTTVSGVVNWQFLAGQTPYTCPNTLTFRVRTDNPLEPNTLYAMILSNEVVSSNDQTLSQDADLSVLLNFGTAPSEGDRLSRPYKCYGPLRAALARSAADGRTINVGQASLFRTQDATAGVKAIAKTLTSLTAEQTPRVESLVKCTAGAVSPCRVEGEASRECPATPSASYDEFHGQLRVPVVQVGTRPYLVDGGYIEYTDGTVTRRAPKSGDQAVVQATENVCFAITVPKTGFTPQRAVAVYGHGTGGNFRSFTGEGQTDSGGALIPGTDLASTLATATPAVAMISFDQPMHGPRRNAAQSPDMLYFNVGNPRAMRDNALQAVVDYGQITGMLKLLAAGNGNFGPGVDATAQSELAAALAGNRRMFIGHSQGGTNGALYVSVAPNTDIGSVLLSGTGGGLIQSLLAKSKPIDFAGLLRGALADPALSEYHPVLNLMQSVAERADPINVGRVMIGIGDDARTLQSLPAVPPAMASPPNPTQAAKSMLHIVGYGDSYTPLRTSSDLWRTFGTVPVFATNADVEPADTIIPGFETSTGGRNTKLKLMTSTADTGAADGLSCNCVPIAMSNPMRVDDGQCGAVTSSDAATLARRTTAATVVYRPERSYDGHFVLFENPAARAQMKAFVQTAAQSDNGFCAPVSPRIPPN